MIRCEEYCEKDSSRWREIRFEKSLDDESTQNRDGSGISVMNRFRVTDEDYFTLYCSDEDVTTEVECVKRK